MQKIRSLEIIAKLSENISKILKMNFIYLSLEKKQSKKQQASIKKYIMAVRFDFCL